MPWEFDNRLPIYVQLVDRLEQAIVSGAFAPGEKVDSVRELASQAGVNPNTMQRALAELEQEGLIYAQRTAGRFVTDDKELIVRMRNRIANDQIKRLFETLLELGYSQEELKRLVQDYFAQQ